MERTQYISLSIKDKSYIGPWQKLAANYYLKLYHGTPTALPIKFSEWAIAIAIIYLA